MAERFTKKSLAEVLVKSIPNAPARTLARRLRNDYPDVFDSLEQARTTIRGVLGLRGGNNRKHATNGRPPRAAGVVPSCPPSQAEPWSRVHIPGPCNVLSISDTHIPYHNQRCLQEAITFAKKRFKIDVLLINGDYGDWYSMSRFLRDPKRRDLANELKAQRDGLEWLAAEFPYARRVLKKGNHDDRWEHWVWNHAAELANCEHMQLAEVLRLADYGFELVGDNIVMLGKLPCFHGHEFGKGGIAAPVNAARGAFLRTLSTNLSAHRHTTSSHTEPDLDKRSITTWTQGCLCDLWPEYARVNKWNWGFAVIEVDKAGLFNLHNFQISKNFDIWRA